MRLAELNTIANEMEAVADDAAEAVDAEALEAIEAIEERESRRPEPNSGRN